MAKSKDDITYGAAQARLSEDDPVRVRYKGGDPLEGGKIADSQPVELFSAAHNIQKQRRGEMGESDQPRESQPPPTSDQRQPQLQRPEGN